MSTVLKSSDVPLAGLFDSIFLDLDGVVYRGGSAVPGAVAAIATIPVGSFGFQFAPAFGPDPMPFAHATYNRAPSGDTASLLGNHAVGI